MFLPKQPWDESDTKEVAKAIGIAAAAAAATALVTELAKWAIDEVKERREKKKDSEVEP